ncbi:uncharacterized protein LOC112499815 [Cynara cardunculus var. scolymus]|uniref:uncharacterized protein LOC112499815 n=1 Tax=Cynara cardunculus var. scolymus TaxID=59895 RepID=UPI000D62D2D9|nr:uncharacterized protein LOC112499815 [Cynara cardunculus var. scolymus]XP_024958858.1 uncharacterized protein LOC112499815 [Cynara cardunculus var. scolymus]
MEIDPPHESDGSTNESKESEIHLLPGNHSGYGLPYAPEDFPEPGDKWGWKVGKRVGVSGHYLDRYLYLPVRLHEKFKLGGFASITSSRGFASKTSVERFVMEAFPATDIKAFFASFTWKIPAEKNKGNKEIVSRHANCNLNLDAAGCKAGNIMCSSLVEASDPSHLEIMDCDICCIEPLFCRDCCCILCSVRIDSADGDNKSFIRCEARVKDGFICGHICHIECALRSYMAGTVGGIIGLDAEYYCRRCDARTDLIPHVKILLQSCESIHSGENIHKILNLCVIILRGSTKPSAKALLHHVQSAVGKLKEGNSQEDIWKREDTSAGTTGELSQCETDTLEDSNFKERKTGSPQIANFDYRIESLELEERIEKTLAALKKSQEGEYRIAEDVLIAQKNHLLLLYEELDKEKGELAKCSPSADPSMVHAVLKRMTQIKNEADKITKMQAVGKGFGKTSKHVLKEHFGVQPDN